MTSYQAFQAVLVLAMGLAHATYEASRAGDASRSPLTTPFLIVGLMFIYAVAVWVRDRLYPSTTTFFDTDHRGFVREKDELIVFGNRIEDLAQESKERRLLMSLTLFGGERYKIYLAWIISVVLAGVFQSRFHGLAFLDLAISFLMLSGIFFAPFLNQLLTPLFVAIGFALYAFAQSSALMVNVLFLAFVGSAFLVFILFREIGVQRANPTRTLRMASLVRTAAGLTTLFVALYFVTDLILPEQNPFRTKVTTDGDLRPSGLDPGLARSARSKLNSDKLSRDLADLMLKWQERRPGKGAASDENSADDGGGGPHADPDSIGPARGGGGAPRAGRGNESGDAGPDGGGQSRGGSRAGEGSGVSNTNGRGNSESPGLGGGGVSDGNGRGGSETSPESRGESRPDTDSRSGRDIPGTSLDPAKDAAKEFAKDAGRGTDHGPITDANRDGRNGRQDGDEYQNARSDVRDRDGGIGPAGSLGPKTGEKSVTDGGADQDSSGAAKDSASRANPLSAKEQVPDRANPAESKVAREKKIQEIQQQLKLPMEVLKGLLVVLAIGAILLALLRYFQGSKEKKEDTIQQQQLTDRQKLKLQTILRQIRSRNLSPSEEVVETYNALLTVFEMGQHPREDWLPAEEFSIQIAASVPPLSTPFQGVTTRFSRTLYGRKSVSSSELDQFRNEVAKILRFFQLA